METYYDVTFKIEILSEFAAHLSTRYYKYAMRNGINTDDKSNAINKASTEAHSFIDRMLSCNSLEELKPFETRLDEMKRDIERRELSQLPQR